MSSSPPPPCDAYQCPSRSRCAAARMACDAFFAYVATGRALAPITIVRIEKQTRRLRIYGVRPVADPSRERFDMIFRRAAPRPPLEPAA